MTMAWLSGTRGAPNAPWKIRATTSSSRDGASPQASDATVNPLTPQSRIVRRENRAASQPVIGVATAVAMMLKVTTRAIWSVVADSAPCICGSDTLAMVTVIA